VISILIAPIVSRMLRFFPPVVTGTIIAVIGISLMRIGINWIFGNPSARQHPTSSTRNTPNGWRMWGLANASVTAPAPAVAASAPAAAASALTAVPAIPKGLALVGTVPNPKYAQLSHIGIASLVLVSILLIAKYAKGFVANISVLLGIIIGAIVATARPDELSTKWPRPAGSTWCCRSSSPPRCSTRS
jgi:xanthine/uracil permease